MVAQSVIEHDTNGMDIGVDVYYRDGLIHLRISYISLIANPSLPDSH